MDGLNLSTDLDAARRAAVEAGGCALDAALDLGTAAGGAATGQVSELGLILGAVEATAQLSSTSLAGLVRVLALRFAK